MTALFQTLTTYPSASDLPSVTIQSCYDGDTCTTTEGEKIRLACIDTPELRGKKTDLIPAKAARDYLNELVAGSTVTIQKCYDGDTCTTTEGEKIRLACIDTPELRGKKADPIPAKAARNYLNDLVAGSTVTIRRITKDRYGRTVAELSKGPMNIQEHLVEKGFASIYERYSSQCEWSMNKI